MENKSTKVCRFCLETSDINFETIKEITFANLDFLWLKLNISLSEEPVMCGNCAKTIENCSAFKTKCLEMENYIASSVIDKDSINIDLREVYMRKMSVEDIVNVPEDNMVCRLCLELVKTDLAIFLRDSTGIVPKLEQYFPELDVACTEDPVICSSCQASLQRYFSFTNICLTSEEKITEYSHVEGTNSMGQIDLNSVRHFISKDFVKCKLEVDTLKIEEIGNDDSENVSNDVEIKKEEILDMELDIKEDSPEQESELTDDNSFQCHPSPSQSDCVPQPTRAKPKRTCKICGYQNKCSGLLQAHVLAHKGIVQEFNCEMCPFKTTTKKYLKRHMLRHKDASEVTMYKCDLCTYETKYKNYLRKHVHRMFHKNKSGIEISDMGYICDLCDYKTKRNSDLKRHMLTHKTHSEITIYKCELCDYETKRKDYLKRHMLVHKTHSEVTIYKCELCDYDTIHKEYLARHVVRHMDVSKIRMYKCDLCPFKSKWRQSFRHHQISHGAVSKPCTIYKCDHCDFETRDKNCLQQHTLVHKDKLEIEMHKCKLCPYETKWHTNLRRHVLAHQNTSSGVAKPGTWYKCDHCDHKTKRNSDLKRHMLTHKTNSEVTMYQCELCDYETKRKDDLKRHMLTHK